MLSTSFISQVTPVILTFNEEPNIRRSLDRLQCFEDVLVIDSGSTDGTLDIVNEYSNTRILTRSFDSFANQWNFALREGAIKTSWTLAMDADYILTDDFINELSKIDPETETEAYRISFDYCIFGKKLSATLYPPIIALYRHHDVHYIQDGHCMRAQVKGKVTNLLSKIQHDDRKPLSRWLASQVKYAEQEAELLLTKPKSELRIQDRLRRKVVIAPWLVPLYSLTLGRGLLDGWAGIYYALQRGIAESILSIKLIESRIKF